MLAALLNHPVTLGELPLPYGGFTDWADRAATLLGVASDVVLPSPSETAWREWALALIDVPGMQPFAFPPPHWDETWVEWAYRIRVAFPGA